MRLLVTGGSGLLGSKVAEISSGMGYDVYSGYNKHEPEFGKGVKLYLLNLSDVANAIREIRPDVIIHSAALTDVDECEVRRELAYRVNVEGTGIVAELSREVGSFMIYISTDYVFDGRKGLYREEDETNPINYYGYTKLLGERFSRGFCVVRTCVVYGARPASGKTNFALWIIGSLKEGRRIRVISDQFVTPTSNTNLARMLLEVAERKLSGVIHLAGATRVSRLEFAEEVARVFGLDSGLIEPSRMEEMRWVARRPMDSSLDVSKATAVLREKPWDLGRSLAELKRELDSSL